MKLKTLFGDDMDITKFNDVQKFFGKINGLLYGINPLENVSFIKKIDVDDEHDCHGQDGCEHPSHREDAYQKDN